MNPLARCGRQPKILLLGLLLLAACAAPPPKGKFTSLPYGIPEEDVDRALKALERSFYEHWGAVENREEFRKLKWWHAKELRRRVDANGPDALMALRVLDRLAPEDAPGPEARAILYASALAREHNFLRWGNITGAGFLPGVYGKELMDLGTAATKPLGRLLVDRRRAPVFGRKVGGGNRDQQDRVCDFAWVMLSEIHDRPLIYHRDPRSRDDEIRKFELYLQRLKVDD